MMRSSHRRIWMAAAACAAIAAEPTAPTARAQSFTFVRAGDSNDGLIRFSPPSINNAGTAAFTANVVGFRGPSGAAILVGNGTARPRAVLSASPTGFSDFTGASINDAGAIGFTATRQTGTQLGDFNGTYRLDGTAVLTIDERDADEATYFSATIQDQGRVAFVRDVNPVTPGGQQPGFGDGGGGEATFLDPPAPATGGYRDVRLASLNVSGDPAFLGTFTVPGGAAPRRHLRYQEVEVVPPGEFDELTALDVNDADQFVFAGVRAGAARVYRTGPTGGTFTPVADGNPEHVAVNNAGLLAALFPDDGDGAAERIMFGPGLATRVIGVNDPLLGSTVTDLAFVNVGLNDAGQIAFYAALADGRSGVYIATVVPEPATAGAGLVLAISTLTRRRRRRR